jgi:hypothetical protein
LTLTGQSVAGEVVIDAYKGSLGLRGQDITLDLDQSTILPVTPAALGLTGQEVELDLVTTTQATFYAASHVTGNVATSINAVGAPNGVYTTNTGNSSWTSRWRMQAPAGGPHVPVETHTVTLRLRKNAAGGGTPTVTSVTLWQNSVQIATLYTGPFSVTSNTGQDLTFSFAGSLLNGMATVDMAVATAANGGGQNARSVQLDSISWVAFYNDQSAKLPVDRRTLLFSGQEVTLSRPGVYELPLDAALITLSGRSVGLSGRIAVGATGLTLSPSVVPSEVVVAKQPGAITLQPQNITLRAGGGLSTSLAVDRNTLTLTGVEIDTEEAVWLASALKQVTGQVIQTRSSEFAFLPVDAATLTLAGQDVGANSRLDCQPGVLSASGQDVRFLNFLVIADGGTLALTGQDVRYGEALPVDAATLGMVTSGEFEEFEITLRSGLTAEAGLVALLDQEVGLSAIDNRTLNVVRVPLSITGQNVAAYPSTNIVLLCEPNALTLTGGESEFVRTATLACDPGLLSVTGALVGMKASLGYGDCVYGLGIYGVPRPAGFCSDAFMQAEVGQIALIGEPIDVALSLGLTVDQRQFTLYGQDVQTVPTGNETIAPDPNELTLTGAEVGLSFTASFVLPVDASAISITPADILLSTSDNPRLGVDADLIELLGQEVEVRWQNNVALATDSGSILLTGLDVGLDRLAGESVQVAGGSITLAGQTVILQASGNVSLGVNPARLALIGQELRNNQRWQQIGSGSSPWTPAQTGESTWDKDCGSGQAPWQKQCG